MTPPLWRVVLCWQLSFCNRDLPSIEESDATWRPLVWRGAACRLAEKIRAARVNKERSLQLQEKAQLAAQAAEYDKLYDTVSGVQGVRAAACPASWPACSCSPQATDPVTPPTVVLQVMMQLDSQGLQAQEAAETARREAGKLGMRVLQQQMQVSKQPLAGNDPDSDTVLLDPACLLAPGCSGGQELQSHLRQGCTAMSLPQALLWL